MFVSYNAPPRAAFPPSWFAIQEKERWRTRFGGLCPFLLNCAPRDLCTGISSSSPKSDPAVQSRSMAWMSRQDLLAAGMTVKGIAAAVHRGDLIRVRRGHYCTPDTDLSLQRAVRVGGRLACVSELRRRGIWVIDDGLLHVQLSPNASRLRSPDDRMTRLGADENTELHWRPAVFSSSSQHVSTLDALICAVSCVERRAAIASIDSALHTRALSPSELTQLRSALPASRRRLVTMADHRAESGLETIVRVLALDLGLRVRVQVVFAGIGRVDLVVEDWIVVETDGAQYHDATVTTRDRRRDAALMARGRTVLHFRYAQVIFELESVAAAIVGAVATHRRVRNSGRIAARARSRMRTLDFS